MWSRSCLWLLALLVVPTALSLAAEPLSVEHFFRDPELTDVHLSPDGRYLSAAIGVEKSKGARNLVLMDLDEGQMTMGMFDLPPGDVTLGTDDPATIPAAHTAMVNAGRSTNEEW